MRTLLLELRDLLSPRLDLVLTLNQQLRKLQTPPLHFAQTTIEHFDFLTTLGELQARLRERLALHIAIGPQLVQPNFAVLNFFAVRICRRRAQMR